MIYTALMYLSEAYQYQLHFQDEHSSPVSPVYEAYLLLLILRSSKIERIGIVSYRTRRPMVVVSRIVRYDTLFI